MNPYLERALVEHYGRQRRNLMLFGGAMLVLAVAVAAWVVVGKPDDGWMSVPVALIGAPCAFGALLLGGWLVFSKPHVLTLLRERPQDLRGVRRGSRAITDQRGRIIREVAAIYVQCADGRELELLFLGDAEEFDRLQKLLEKEIAK